jgi:hypothetical protein
MACNVNQPLNGQAAELTSLASLVHLCNRRQVFGFLVMPLSEVGGIKVAGSRRMKAGYCNQKSFV